MSLDLHVLSLVETVFEFLDRSPAAVLLLDERRRVVYANGHATVLHGRHDGISLFGGAFALVRQQDDVRLQELISRTLVTKSLPPSVMRAMRLTGKQPYAIFLARLSARLVSASRMRPSVCVVITDPESTRSVPVDRLQAIFGLTEAEGRLASLLASGDDLRSAAKTLGITYGTARARLAEVFQKTETRRQGELINLLLTTSAIV